MIMTMKMIILSVIGSNFMSNVVQSVSSNKIKKSLLKIVLFQSKIVSVFMQANQHEFQGNSFLSLPLNTNLILIPSLHFSKKS